MIAGEQDTLVEPPICTRRRNASGVMGAALSIVSVGETEAGLAPVLRIRTSTKSCRGGLFSAASAPQSR